MRDFFLVLLGGICSALGGCAAGCVAIWYPAKKARQIRMEERAGERQFEVSVEALALIRKLRILLVKRKHENAQQFFRDNGCWFADNWMFLPNGFIEGWKSVGLGLGDLSRAENALRKEMGLKDAE